MNATSQPQPAATAEVQLTRAAKEKLLLQMYRLAHWIELIRLFGYQTLPMEQARQAIKPIADKFGKEPVATACEAMVEISTPDKEPVARLKPHIRRMAFQILGPEPTPDAVTPPLAKPESKEQDSQVPAVAKKRKSASKPSPPTKAKSAAVKSNGQIPIMEQYRAAKEKHPNMLLLFRMGDFYELFDQDAETAHKLLGLTLTTRDRTITMAGFPHHQLESYLHKLLQSGQRVAICEPVEDSIARGPIRREVTRVVTPGTLNDEPKPQLDGTASNGGPVRQPRVHVLKQYEAWLNKNGLAFVAVDDVQRTTPAVAPFVSALDFIVLRGDEKLLVTVRTHLQAKHLHAIRELQKLFGADYKPVRIWPDDGPNGWEWPDHAIGGTAGPPTPKRSRAKKSH